MGYANTSHRVVNFLENTSKGEVLSVSTIAKATGLTEKQVRTSMRTLIDRGLPIEIVLAGNAWRYGATAEDIVAEDAPSTVVKKGDEFYEPVGSMSDDTTVVKGNNTGTLFRLVRL